MSKFIFNGELVVFRLLPFPSIIQHPFLSVSAIATSLDSPDLSLMASLSQAGMNFRLIVIYLVPINASLPAR